ncbi:MAG: DNA polymerase III subunit alpha [Chloroflexi bacterium]|nr:DNA polymerase III subunit alpha [Chloroflexota bacterium]
MNAVIPLHCHSYFSLLRGVGSPAALVARAAALGYPALALTDRDALYGAIRFQQACRQHGLKPIFGAEATLLPATPPHAPSPRRPVAPSGWGGVAGWHVTLLAMDLEGYGNLSRLISRSRLAHEKGSAGLPFEALAEHARGLICLSGPLTGEVPRLLRAGQRRAAARAAARYREVFGDRYYLELQHHSRPDDRWLIAELAALGRHLGIPLVATADVHYPAPEDRALQDVVTCIRTRTTLAAPSPERLPNGQFFLEPPDQFAAPFRRYPEALANTHAIADRCDVTLDFRDIRFPPLSFLTGPDRGPERRTPDDELRRRCEEGARWRYGEPLDRTGRVWRQLDHELRVIAQRGLAPFFLIAGDIARRFRGRCRGSAAGSLVIYCLGVSVVDPLEYDMLFERFINPERDSPADIDIDFTEPERERALAYCYATYGAERTGMVCNYVRFRARSAVRDVGKVLGMPLPLLDRLARSLGHYAGGEEVAEGIARFAEAEELPPSVGATPPWPLLARFCRELDDTPRHLSIHVGGMLITGKPLVEIFALEPARKEGIVVAGADKEDVEDAGLCKLDLLCLHGISVVHECEELERARGVPLDLATINLEDPRVYASIRRADTLGASQVESRAQMQSVVRTRPRNFADLMVQVAIIRPGPITGGMVHPYYRRRAGEEPVCYLHPSLEPILRSTLGIFLYQEQVLLGVSALTGCSAGEADLFRRAMGSHRSHEAMERLRPWFIERAVANGIAPAVATAVFQQVAGFAEYGFCKSHAAALARLAYETMYLKRHHPAAFTAALLNNQPMGFYPVEVIYWDARRHGVVFQPVDVERSGARCTLEGDPPTVRLGFAQVRGVSAAAAERIVVEREAAGPCRSLADFCRRLGANGLTGKAVEGLILAGAFDRFGRSREDLLWEHYSISTGRRGDALREGKRGKGEKWKPGFHPFPLDPFPPSTDEGALDIPEEPADLPERSAHEQTLLDYVVLGFSLDHHLVEHYRQRLAGLRVVSSDRLARWPDGKLVRVGGLVVCRQRPGTAKGFVFLTLEDERGLVNVVVRPDVYARYRSPLRDYQLVAIAGRIQRTHGMVNILAERALALDLATPDPGRPSPQPSPTGRGGQHPDPVGAPAIRSHDFH